MPDQVYPSVKKLIANCWAHDPSQRPTFHEIIDTLRTDVTEEVLTLTEPNYTQEDMLDLEEENNATKTQGETREAEARTAP